THTRSADIGSTGTDNNTRSRDNRIRSRGNRTRSKGNHTRRDLQKRNRDRAGIDLRARSDPRARNALLGVPRSCGHQNYARETHRNDHRRNGHHHQNGHRHRRNGRPQNGHRRRNGHTPTRPPPAETATATTEAPTMTAPETSPSSAMGEYGGGHNRQNTGQNQTG